MIKKVALTFMLFMVCGMVLHAEDSPKQNTASSSSSSSGSSGQQQFEGFNLAGYNEHGDKSWDVKGDTADMVGNIVKLTNIVANAYGDEKMNLTAKSGTMDQASGNMHLEKDVVITSETGARLTTDSLDWQRDKDLVTTNDRVKIQNDKITAVGTGAVAHPGLKTAEMKEDVVVKVDTEKTKSNGNGAPLTITCDGPMEVDQAHQRAFFNNNVVAEQEGRRLKADRIEIYFDQKTNQIQQLVCIGNVAITQGENTSYAEKAVYTASDQKLVLSGRPKLILVTEGKNSIASFGN